MPTYGQMPVPQQQPPGAGAQMNGGALMAPQTPPVDPAMMEAIEKTSKAIPWEDIVEVLKGGVSRRYRIDIETDSTVRGDIRQQQEQMSLFFEGTASFWKAIYPMVEVGAMPRDVAVDLYTAATRTLRLGKQAEDALARFGQAAQEEAQNPQPPQPDPEMLKAEAEMKIAQQSHQAEMERGQQDMQMAREKHQADITMSREKHGLEMEKLKFGAAIEQQSAELKAQGEQRKQEMDFINTQRKDELDYESQRREAALNAQTQQQEAAIDMQRQREAAQHEKNTAHLNEYMKVQEHKRKMQQPAGQKANKGKAK